MMKYVIPYIIVFLCGLVGGFFGHDYFYPATESTVSVSDTSTTHIPDPFQIWIPLDDSSTVGNEPKPDIVHDTIFHALIETVYVDTSAGKNDFRYTKKFDFDSIGFSIEANVRTDTSVHAPPGLSLRPFDLWYRNQITTNTTMTTQQDGMKVALGGYAGYRRVELFAGIGKNGNYFTVKTTNGKTIEIGYMRTFDSKGLGLWSLWKTNK